jgi:hypothetical protein
MLSYSVNVSLVRRETPRLCRGGSKSLTAPAVCFSIQVPGPLALRLGACKFCHPFYQSLWHFLPVQVFSGEMTPAILQSCSTTLGLLRATERVSREVTTALGKQAARAIVGGLG